MRTRGKPGHKITENPFYVLGLAPDCSRAEVEREGQKLLGMLELGLSAARSYDTPLGCFDRTPEKVREAMAELRDPDRRLGHELWARVTRPADSSADSPGTERATDSSTECAIGPKTSSPPAWTESLAVLGWRRL